MRAAARMMSRVLRRAFVVLLFAFASVTPAGAQELRWGGDAEGGAPFVEADPRDPSRVVGFDVEVAQVLASGLGRQAASSRWGLPVLTPPRRAATSTWR
jgi:polar amino acid transport system substrate-binding protein